MLAVSLVVSEFYGFRNLHNLGFVPQAHSTAGGVQGETRDFPTGHRSFLGTRAGPVYKHWPGDKVSLDSGFHCSEPGTSQLQDKVLFLLFHLIPSRCEFCLWWVVLSEAVEGV